MPPLLCITNRSHSSRRQLEPSRYRREVSVIEAPAKQQQAVFSILGAVSFCHLLNDMVQSLIPAIYPLLKNSFRLNFGQIGLITLTFQLTASLLQPLVGLYTDKRPMPYSLPAGMALTLVGLLTLSIAPTFGTLLCAAALVGMGSAVFHPESSRVARLASGGQHGLAQSLFQVGGNAGSAIGPLLAAFIVLPHGQGSVAWFSLAALLGMAVLLNVGSLVEEEQASGCGIARSWRRAASPGTQDCPRNIHPACSHLFEILLSGEPEQLLHVLSDQPVPCVGTERATAPVPVSGRGRGGNHRRRPHR